MPSDPLVLTLPVAGAAALGALAAALVLRARAATLARELATARAAHADAVRERDAARVQAAVLEQRLADQRAFLDAAEARLRDAFAAASQQALERNAAFLAGQARQALGAEQERIALELRPVAESVAKLQAFVAGVDRARGEADAQLREQLQAMLRSHRELGDETRKLVRALRDPRARGSWGELQLRRVVEHAGMLAHCDFEEQVTIAAGGEVQRPDLVVRLPGGKCLVVDAKAPLAGYLDAVEATGDDARDAALAQHAVQLRAHVKALADRRYWAALPGAPEFVILFVPGEAFLQAALVADASLLDDALARNVMLASPVTLVTLLKSAAYGWQQERLARNAEEIRREASVLAERLGHFAGHLAKVGDRLRAATAAYNDAAGSYDRRLLPSARRMGELGVGVPEAVEGVLALELLARDVPLRAGAAVGAGGDDGAVPAGDAGVPGAAPTAMPAPGPGATIGASPS